MKLLLIILLSLTGVSGCKENPQQQRQQIDFRFVLTYFNKQVDTVTVTLSDLDELDYGIDEYGCFVVKNEGELMYEKVSCGVIDFEFLDWEETR